MQIIGARFGKIGNLLPDLWQPHRWSDQQILIRLTWQYRTIQQLKALSRITVTLTKHFICDGIALGRRHLTANRLCADANNLWRLAIARLTWVWFYITTT